jgi:hypothetical protein
MKKALFTLALLGASAFGLASAATKPKNTKAVIKTAGDALRAGIHHYLLPEALGLGLNCFRFSAFSK